MRSTLEYIMGFFSGYGYQNHEREEYQKHDDLTDEIKSVQQLPQNGTNVPAMRNIEERLKKYKTLSLREVKEAVQ